tara:strand:- start:67720 stop:68397 length:678 start_codon:yes stop_codon:yes gene_type:complete
MSKKHFVIILAAGQGTRMGSDVYKQFLVLGKTPVLMHSISKFYQFDKKSVLSVILPKNKITFWKSLCQSHNFKIDHNVFSGGVSRYESVKSALNNLPICDNDIVSIHDGVRPFISIKLIKKLFFSALKKNHAAPYIISKDSIRINLENNKTMSVNRNNYLFTQTPQVFIGKLIKKAYEQQSETKTDDVSLIENIVKKVNLIKGEDINFKITTKEDWYLARKIIKS